MAKNGSISVSGKWGIAAAPWTATLKWGTSGQSIANNSSTVTWELSLYFRGGLVATNKRNCSVVFNGQTVFNDLVDINVPLTNNHTKILASGKTTIPHAFSGTKNFDYSFSLQWDISGDNTPYLSTSGTGVLDSITRGVGIITAPNFNDEENPTITYEAFPSGVTTKVEAAITTGSLTNPEVAYRSISDSGSALITISSTERANLYAKMATTTSTTVNYIIRSTFIDGAVLYKTKTASLTLVNDSPTITPTVEDVNERTYELTGNRQKFIKYYSNAKITVGAAARKGASIEYRTIQNGTQFLDDYTSDTATFNAIESNTFYLSATDTRRRTTKDFKVIDLIDYVKFTCALSTEPLDASGNLTFTIDGKYYSGSFGADSNELEVEYSLRDSKGNYISSSESGWVVLGVVSPTVDGTNYTYSYTITGLDHEEQYELTVNAFDKLTPIQTTSTIVQAIPIFDWGKNDFHHHTDVYLQRGKTLRSISDDGEEDRAIISTNPGDTTVSFGYGNYSASEGETRIYGNTINLLSRGDIKLNSQTLADYVVEDGSNGAWHYRKWNSGRVELDGYRNVSNVACNSVLGGWYQTVNLTSPVFPFTVNNPKVVATWNTNGYGAVIWFTTSATSERPGQFYLIRPTSSPGVTGVVNYYVTGTWK